MDKELLQPNHIKVFVSSTVYDCRNDLDRLYALLDGWGYEVMMSHKGTIPLDSRLSNAENCVKGVEMADVFLGFIRPVYGSGVLERGALSITEQELDAAMRKGMPRFMLADYRVKFGYDLLNVLPVDTDQLPEYFVRHKKRDGKEFDVKEKNLVLDGRCVEMYKKAIKDLTPANRRKGNWVHEFYNWDQIKLHVESQFSDVNRIKSLLAYE